MYALLLNNAHSAARDGRGDRCSCFDHCNNAQGTKTPYFYSSYPIVPKPPRAPRQSLSIIKIQVPNPPLI